MKQGFGLALAAMLGASVVAMPAGAATFDAFAKFNGTQGAGNFHYGEAFPGGAYTEFSSNTNCNFAPRTSCLHNASGQNNSSNGLPIVQKSLVGSFKFSTANVPGNALLLHPGPNSSSRIAFLAPHAGTYSLSALFFIADDFPTGVSVTPFTGPNGGALSFNPSFFLNFSNPASAFSRNIFLNTNDLFGFDIGPNGNFTFDSTGVNFTAFTPGGGGAVPEPASWALMIAGFGLTGAAMRRRRGNVRVLA